MLTKLQHQITIYLLEKAKKEIDKGDFKAIKKGLKYLKLSVWFMPKEVLPIVGTTLNNVINANDLYC